MRVGLDLLFLLPGETGGRETYVRELIPELLTRSPELELVAFVNREAGERVPEVLGKQVRRVVVPISARSRPQWALGELALVSVAARRARVELLHSMANFAPSWGPFPRVLTVHDLQYRATPELLSPVARLATGALVALAARGADRIIAVSQAGREEIVSGLGVDPEQIDVIPNGVRTPSPTSPSGSTLTVPDPHRLDGRRVVLTVATNLPHKNLGALIRAIALMDPATRPLLVLAGHGTDDGSLRATAQSLGVADSVRLLGGVSKEELELLYARADCLALASLHEGFGLPVLEAMVRSLPVLCSDIPALREVAGPGALYFDPRAPAQMAARISDLLAGDALAARLRDLGRKQAAGFSWTTAAASTLDSYERALHNSSAKRS